MSTTAVRSPAEFKAEQMPLRTAQARLAVIDGYADRDELGEIYRAKSAEFNEQRLDLMRAYEELEADLSEEPDPVARNEEEKQISMRDLARALENANDEIETRFISLRE